MNSDSKIDIVNSKAKLIKDKVASNFASAVMPVVFIEELFDCGSSFFHVILVFLTEDYRFVIIIPTESSGQLLHKAGLNCFSDIFFRSIVAQLFSLCPERGDDFVFSSVSFLEILDHLIKQVCHS